MIIDFANLIRLKKEKTVCTVGSWDLFHRGHLNFLRRIKKEYPEYKLVVGVLNDKAVGLKKGLNRPVIKEKDRVEIINAIKYIDYSFICSYVYYS
jgi:cytidyltransferase-like protein